MALLALLTPAWGQEPRTEITKWQDGKAACISLTYDDSTINQFRIDIPLLNERHIPGTFFVITGDIQGSRNQPTFVGRPIMEILRESAPVPTTKENALERISMLNYLQTVRMAPELTGFSAQRMGGLLRRGDPAALATAVDGALSKLRQSGAVYTVGPRKSPVGDPRYAITWDDLRRYAAEGHEIANHSVTHPFMPALDEANIVYEIEKANDEIRQQMGARHTFSIEAPYGIDDPRVRPLVTARFALTRNWVTDDFMEGFLRDDRRDPTTSTREYVQWQRGPLTRTTLDLMKSWVDTSIGHGIWLVLVFHGVEGIGYEPLPTETHRAYYDYIADHRSRLWLATFQDGAKYARERVHSKVTTSRSGDAITVTVTHSLDAKVYDLPLTARTEIPADWKIVRIRQGDDVRWLPISREGANSSVIYGLLLFLYNTGARADEAAQSKIADLTLAQTPRDHSLVQVHGKGNKLRRCPLWPQTAAELSSLILGRPTTDHVFLNRSGNPITRFGIHTMIERHVTRILPAMTSLAGKQVSPHTIRHTTATHLLRAGVDVNTIRAWLGHVSLSTTNIYAEVDMEMKAKALATCEVRTAQPQKHWREDTGLLQFLRSL